MTNRYDYIEQSAVIPYKTVNGKIKILLITSNSGKRWVLPKGVIEHYLSPQDSAAKEAREEAGIIGQVHENLMGIYKYDKWGGTCRVKVYLMKVEKELSVWLEDHRIREWLELDEAIERVREKELKKIIKNAIKKLE